ncbi:phage tail tape measure protein [Nonlabens sp.]|jgi:hypothetical protein|uniref:phage tail tape measure protein n=1 Tax=Nonlabens sp. TaxID=1888209 RepID=UPI0039E5B3A1
MANLASINVKFIADLAQFSGQMQNANRKLQKTGKAFTSAGKNLSIGLTAPIVALGAVSFKTFADFEQGLAKVRAVSGATASEFKALSDNASLLGRTTAFTATQVAELQLNYSKLGFKPKEIVAATAATLDLALATGEDLASSATVAASTLKGFGLEVDQIGRVTDVMAKSFSSSALDLEKFKVAMAVVAPVAKNAGVTLEEATAQLSVLVDAGVDASTASTGLRNIFLDIADKGITFKDALDSINNSANRNVTALDLFGKRGATVAAVLAENQEKAAGLTAEYQNAAGAAAAMAKIMSSTAQGGILRMQSALEGAAIQIGEVLAPFMNHLADLVGELANKFSDLDDDTKKIIVVVASLAAALGPLLIAIGFLATNVIPGLIQAFALLRTAFMAITAFAAANPFGAIAIAVGLIVSAFLLLNQETKRVIDQTTLLASVTKQAAEAVSGEAAEVKKLLFFARDEKLSKEQRIKAIRQLNKISPEYLGTLTLEKINTDAATASVNLYNEALLKSAKVKAAQNKLQEISAQIIENEIKASERRQQIVEDQSNKSRGGDARKDALSSEAGQLQAVDFLYDKLNASLRKKEEILLDILKANKSMGSSLAPVSSEITRVSAAVGELKNKGAIQPTDLINVESGQPLIKDFKLFGGIPVNEQVLAFEIEMLRMKALAEQFNESITNAMNATAENFAVGFGQLIASAATGGNFLQGFFTVFVGSLADMAIQVGKTAIGIGIAVLGIKKALTSLSGPVAIAAGIALVALGTLAKSTLSNISGGGATPFASGGIVSGPVNALVGEYAGARNNPEVIAPLDKLKKLIEPAASANGVVIIEGEFVMRGNDLIRIVTRTETKNKRTR